MELIPDITQDQLKVLEALFPNALPPRGATAEDLAFLQGQQNIIERLRLDFNRYLSSE